MNLIFASASQAGVVISRESPEAFHEYYYAYPPRFWDQFHKSANRDSKLVKDSGAVWYAQFHWGWATYTGDYIDGGIEIGNHQGPDDYDQTSYSLQKNYGVSISADASRNLNAIWNGVSAGDGLPLTEPYNEIWIQLYVDTRDPLDITSLSNMFIDAASLPDMTARVPSDGNYDPDVNMHIIKVRFDDRPTNIGEFSLTADW